MSGAPHPEVVRRDLATIRAVIEEKPMKDPVTAVPNGYRGMLDQYRWLHKAGLGANNRSEVKLALTGKSDSTGTVAVEDSKKVAMRAAAEHAAKLTHDAARMILAARKALVQADAILEHALPAEPTHRLPGYIRQHGEPDYVSEARENKAKREAAGLGWGES